MRQRGFGLMELLVVVGIIAILGAIALPQYNKYVTKTRITEALHHGQVYARKYESEAAGGGDAGTIPTLDHATISITGSGADTRVNVTLKNSIDSQALIDSDDTAGGKILELGLIGSSGATRWECKTNLSDRLMPKVCTYKADVGGIAEGTAWADVPEDKRGDYTACWDQAVADSGDGNGWVVGENLYGTWGFESYQANIREDASRWFLGEGPTNVGEFVHLVYCDEACVCVDDAAK